MSLEEKTSGSNAAAATNLTSRQAPTAGVHLWWCDLTPTAALLDQYSATLSVDEHARAARFGTAELRNRYVMGRGALRQVLARVLGVRPITVSIVRGVRGRPQLAGVPSLDFNVSHTTSVALIGLAEQGRIGVDVESIDRAINTTGIARKFMTLRERDELATFDAEGQRRRVLTLWTCKEAISKATGEALAAPFGRIDVDISSGPRLRAGPSPYEPDFWSLHAADVPPGYVATVARWSAPI